MRVCPPPALSHDSEPASTSTVTLTIKSLKPPLVFSLPAPPTATIATLKALLVAQEPSAPPVEAQRWILKGKAMGDAKLLKEFAGVEDGAVVNLMIKATPTPLVPVSAPTDEPVPMDGIEVPALTLSSPLPSPNPAAGPASSRPPLSISTTSIPVVAPARDLPTGIAATISDPALWSDAYDLLRKRFGEARESDVREVWEAWFGGAQGWIEPGAKALIRERVGISAMGGL